MVSIAREILLHDKLRFAITVVSLGFAIVMIVYDTAMFFGVTGDSVSLIDRSQAQLWVFKKGNDHLSAPSLVPHSLLGKARKMAGVGEACALDYRMGNLQVARNHQVAIVGIDPACPLLLPWNVVQGDLESLARKDTVIVDDLALRSDPAAVGDVVKINDQKLHVVGVTHGNKSFSYPFVYVNQKTFETIGGSPDDYSFVMVQVTPGADQNQVIRQLTGVNDMDAHTAQEFSAATITALIAQGVGMIFVVVAVGVFVGMLIVTLTMYTATMEHLRVGLGQPHGHQFVDAQAPIHVRLAGPDGLADGVRQHRVAEDVADPVRQPLQVHPRQAVRLRGEMEKQRRQAPDVARNDAHRGPETARRQTVSEGDALQQPRSERRLRRSECRLGHHASAPSRRAAASSSATALMSMPRASCASASPSSCPTLQGRSRSSSTRRTSPCPSVRPMTSVYSHAPLRVAARPHVEG